ncbi:hypothetical protein KY333_00145 [Candidatus Woesearchaeota archaeon]|nr:hypothetical protein [Candidatus Woesearchaeota archaeon]MBW2994193.1 hypothetical protein [Candidatus Woesearchaeota archaeon]
MKVFETRVCHSGKAIKLIVTEWMDTLAIVINAKAYMLYDKGKFISLCCIKDLGSIQELGVVITKKAYRGRGYMANLLNYVLKDSGPLYLICLAPLGKYYKRFGFKKISKPPWQLSIRAEPYNFFARLFNWDKIIYMKRN